VAPGVRLPTSPGVGTVWFVPGPRTALVGCALLLTALCGCTGTQGTVEPPVTVGTIPTIGPAPSVTTPPPPTTPAAPTPGVPTPAVPAPGEPCDPADGSPDCTDASVDGTFRQITGYADCVGALGPDEAHGMCTDLDGDGAVGYPDSQ